ncbi:ABC transporter G family member 48-like protein [Drosera capensis]
MLRFYSLDVGTGNTVLPVVSVERTVFYRERARRSVFCHPICPRSGHPVSYEKQQAMLLQLFNLKSIYYDSLTGCDRHTIHHSADLAILYGKALLESVLHALHFLLLQSIPIWWRWLFWANPMVLSMYGLVGSQYRDVKDMFEGGSVSKGVSFPTVCIIGILGASGCRELTQEDSRTL